MQTEIHAMVQDATKAPSGHNTQPWLFEIREKGVTIRPDLTRRLKVVDPDDHALFISLGCALENLIISATAHGFEATVSFHLNNDREEIMVDLEKKDGIPKDPLYDHIQERQSTRTAFDPEPIAENKLAELALEANNDGVEVILISGKTKIGELTPFILEANLLQFSNKHFVNELVSWIRFSKKEAEQKGDGVWGASMGMPGVGRWLGSFIMKDLVSPKSETKRWKAILEKTAGLALFIARENNREHWIRLGQSFERFALKATQLGLKHAHVNMPCEEISVRQKLIRHFNLINGEQPLLLVRFGYAKTMPYSLRRPLHEVLTNT